MDIVKITLKILKGQDNGRGRGEIGGIALAAKKGVGALTRPPSLYPPLVLPKNPFFMFSVCNFQSMKSPVELSSPLLKFFCYITWFVISPD